MRWTTDDFEKLGWHDCHVHGFRMGRVDEEMGTAEVVIDLDYIGEWISGEGVYRFRVAPATLTFHEVSGLRVVVDYAGAGMVPWSIDGIEREALVVASGEARYRWKMAVNWPKGEITFESAGFTQELRGEAVEREGQWLRAEERGGTTVPEWYVPEDATPREVCPCCDYVSLAERGKYLICRVCYWEDEGIDVDELDAESGANEGLTLREARGNFATYGAFAERWAGRVCSAEERAGLERRVREVK